MAIFTSFLFFLFTLCLISNVNSQRPVKLIETRMEADPEEVKIADMSKAEGLNEFDEMGRTPLMNAAKHGHWEAVQHLCKAGVEVDMQTVKEGLTPLIMAAELGLFHTVKELISCDADPNIVSKNGKTALSSAVVGGFADITRLLLQSGADANHKIGWEELSPLMVACAEKRPDSTSGNAIAEVLKLLIDHGANVNYQNKYGNSPLMFAVISGDQDSVTVLMKASAKLDAKNAQGMTALMFAASRGFPRVIEALLSDFVPQSVKDSKDIYGNTAIRIAAEASEKECVDSLIEYGADFRGLGLSISPELLEKRKARLKLSEL